MGEGSLGGVRGILPNTSTQKKQKHEETCEELFYVLHHHRTANEIRSGKLYIPLLEYPDMEH